MSTVDRRALGASLACGGAFAALLGLAYGPHVTRWVDAQSLAGFMSLRGGWISELGRTAGGLTDAASYLALSVLLLAFGVWLKAYRTTLIAALVLVGAPAMAQVLKTALAAQRIPAEFDSLHVAAAAFPSGHATGAMALGLAAVLIAPRPQERVVWTAAAFVLIVSVGLVMSGNHLPSDVLAAYLLATVWVFFLFGLLGRGRTLPPGRSHWTPPPRTWTKAVGVACAAAGLASVVRNGPAEILHEPSQTAALVLGVGAFVAGALSLLSLTSALAPRPAQGR